MKTVVIISGFFYKRPQPFISNKTMCGSKADTICAHPAYRLHTPWTIKRTNLFLSVTSSKSTDLHAVFTVRFKMNGTCDVHFTHLTYLILLHYLVKVETPKVFVNANSAFNVNYEIAVKCIKLH